MTEKELTAKVIAECGRHGLLVHHCTDSRKCEGTKGIPDLVIASFSGVLFAELKNDYEDTSADQDLWLLNLHRAGVPYAVWRPAHWENGKVQDRLRAMAS